MTLSRQGCASRGELLLLRHPCMSGDKRQQMPRWLEGSRSLMDFRPYVTLAPRDAWTGRPRLCCSVRDTDMRMCVCCVCVYPDLFILRVVQRWLGRADEGEGCEDWRTGGMEIAASEAGAGDGDSLLARRECGQGRLLAEYLARRARSARGPVRFSPSEWARSRTGSVHGV